MDGLIGVIMGAADDGRVGAPLRGDVADAAVAVLTSDGQPTTLAEYFAAHPESLAHVRG
jgi:hypothetical protein